MIRGYEISMTKLKGAIVGIGGIGKLHGKQMVESGGIDLVALCDSGSHAMEISNREFPGVPLYDSIEQLFDAHSIDLVTIATPHYLHAPLAITALKAGANVVVEKPMATTYSDCLLMIKTAHECKKALTVYHNRRLDGWFLAAQHAINDGLIGEVFELSSGIGYPVTSATWRGSKEMSGGVMFDWGAHLVDYIVHFDASDIVSVSGRLYRCPTSNPDLNEDHGTLSIQFASGAVGNVSVSSLEFTSRERYRILGTGGTLTDAWNWGDEHSLKVFSKLTSGEPTTTDVKYHKTEPEKYYRNLVDHIVHGDNLLVTAESAARNINILETAERSHKAGGVPLVLA